MAEPISTPNVEVDFIPTTSPWSPAEGPLMSNTLSGVVSPMPMKPLSKIAA